MASMMDTMADTMAAITTVIIIIIILTDITGLIMGQEGHSVLTEVLYEAVQVLRLTRGQKEQQVLTAEG